MIESRIEETANIEMTMIKTIAEQTLVDAVQQFNSSGEKLTIAANLTDARVPSLHVNREGILFLLSAEGSFSAVLK